jgi:dipeptidyl aminopeptidase/acylaminoacyl peptidase
MKFPAFVLFLTGMPVSVMPAQDIRAEMERAAGFGRDAASHVVRNEIQPYWVAGASQLVYRVKRPPNEHRFVQVDLKSGDKSPAFDHEALAKALAKAAAQDVRADSLPLEQVEITAKPGIVRFKAFGKVWRFEASNTTVVTDDAPPQSARPMSHAEAGLAARHNSGAPSLTLANDTAAPNSPLASRVATDAPSSAPSTSKEETADKPQPKKPDEQSASPDGQWRVVIRDLNPALEPIAGGDPVPLATDGTKEEPYTGPLQWSPDSKKLIIWRTRDSETRKIHIVQSSPPDQLQPKLLTLNYAKPGDPIRQTKPYLFDIASRSKLTTDTALFDNPWSIQAHFWMEDSSEFTFVYNQRGHQVMRILGIRADSGAARVIMEDSSKTFINYSDKFYLHRIAATRELVWASERDGYNHLYLIDEAAGKIKNPITKGDWNVRKVVEIDNQKRQLLLEVCGMPDQDPYHQHFVRVNFDGSGFTRLTTSDGTHKIEFSPDRQWIIDSWSRVDQPPVVELRRADNGQLVAELERDDDSALQKTGWSRPERFTAKGRDGKTDIYGIIIRPTRFDPNRKYPVVEDIYAGPQDHFVPKKYFTWSNKYAMAELGFIVVSIDGMGTNWRSKAFHDVCWKNLADSGFPDRIAWIKAAAATRPWMDLTRVGLYGGSAGGQSTLAGLLHHGDFYKVGVADCGCHDNRMDKIWWNEAWMGWPVDESYARNSNATHAEKLTGKLMLVVGEIDHNVDPASTSQVVAALQKAGKNFDFLPIMNANHGAAESPYGKYRRAEFLVRNLSANGLPTP